MEDFHELLGKWESFYLLVGTAGATLAGLMFVVLNFSERFADRERIPILRAHSDPALLALVLTLLLGALMLMPTITHFWLAAPLLAAGLLGLIYTAVVLRQIVRAGVVHTWDASDWAWYAAAPVVSGVLLLLSGVLTLTGASSLALTLTGVTLMVLLTMGLRNAWDLVTYSVEDGSGLKVQGQREERSGD